MTALSRQRADCSFGRQHRLLKSAQFSAVYAFGSKYFGAYMILWLRESPDAGLRVGVVASKRVGNASQRNKAKRRLRELFRRHRHRFLASGDVVLVARRTILAANWPALEEELLRLAASAGILEQR